ncbi:MAG TPA: T9SS type A sorting domain-containing protein [Draconibacterium sp.]|nr:T9SS type A sorting domain-containing protein [Draconibacterium sp.]
MRKLLLLLFSISCTSIWAQKVLFLHHSTGNNLFYGGNVAEYIQDYNTSHFTDYQITELSYPNTPYPWENYPYDYWNLWVNQSCDNENQNIMCLDEMANNYDVIIWKHCFPGAAIQPDNDNPDVNSSVKTLANYKLQYRALLNLMSQYPDTKFIVWTLVPLHRNATSPEQAGRANEFVNWGKDSWLQDNGSSHSNIYIFDFFSNAAEMNPNPENGVQYCLKYEYEGDHNGSDSHPNKLANETIGPVFSKFIIDVIEDNLITTLDNNRQIPSVKILQNISSGILNITGKVESVKSVDFINITGQKVLSISGRVQQINTNSLQQGIYVVQINCENEKFNYKILIQ